MADDQNQAQDNLDDSSWPTPAPLNGGDGLQKELETCKTQAAEYLEGWQRARAEFANYKRRVEKEQSEAYQTATGRVIVALPGRGGRLRPRHAGSCRPTPTTARPWPSGPRASA